MFAKTARERTREVCATVNESSCNNVADAASDVWEPLLREAVELLSWIDRPVKFALGEEEAEALMRKFEEALGIV